MELQAEGTAWPLVGLVDQDDEETLSSSEDEGPSPQSPRQSVARATSKSITRMLEDEAPPAAAASPQRRRSRHLGGCWRVGDAELFSSGAERYPHRGPPSREVVVNRVSGELVAWDRAEASLRNLRCSRRVFDMIRPCVHRPRPEEKAIRQATPRKRLPTSPRLPGAAIHPPGALVGAAAHAPDAERHKPSRGRPERPPPPPPPRASRTRRLPDPTLRLRPERGRRRTADHARTSCMIGATFREPPPAPPAAADGRSSLLGAQHREGPPPHRPGKVIGPPQPPSGFAPGGGAAGVVVPAPSGRRRTAAPYGASVSGPGVVVRG